MYFCEAKKSEICLTKTNNIHEKIVLFVRSDSDGL